MERFIIAQQLSRSNIGKIWKISEETPDLTYSFMKEVLLAHSEVLCGDVSCYEFG